jgi:glycine dehydrogenase subunit 1
MAARMTGRNEVLVAGSTDPERLAVIRNYCEPREMAGSIALELVDYEHDSGLLDVGQLQERISERTAAVYVESPSYLGVMESRAVEIADISRGHSAETILGVDPIALGVATPPGELGADMAVGPIQTLGVHMNCGGGAGGFIASRDEERYAREYPTLMVSACPTMDPERVGFGMTLLEQSSYGSREKGNDWTGTSVYLWAIASAVYMSLLGPRGFEEVGELILSRSHYAAARLAELPGVEVRFASGFFKEFVVDFQQTGRTVAEINDRLRAHSIFGGRDLSKDFPELGQSALYCVTEIHTQQDVDRLFDVLALELGR